MRGMVRTADERARLVEAYRASGLSANAFAERERIPSSTLYQWLARPKRAAPSVRIAKVICRAAAPSTTTSHDAAIVIDFGAIRVHVPRGFDRAALGDVLDFLAARDRATAT